MNIFYCLLLWIHLLSMSSLFGLLIACKVLFDDPKSVLKLSVHCRTFFALLFVSGFILLYLKIMSAFNHSQKLNTAIYHILLTKFFFLLGLGHFIFVGSKKNKKTWVNASLLFIVFAVFLGLLLRYY